MSFFGALIRSSFLPFAKHRYNSNPCFANIFGQSLKTCHRQLFPPSSALLFELLFLCLPYKKGHSTRLCPFLARLFGARSCRLQSIVIIQNPCFANVFGQSLKTCHRQLFPPSSALLFELLFLCLPYKKGHSTRLCPFLARHEELESPTFGSVDQRSIQLS